MATSSVTELVQAVRRPRALSESTNCSLVRRSEGGSDSERSEAVGWKNSENTAPPRRHSVAGTRVSMQKISELPEKKPKKSGRVSFMACVPTKSLYFLYKLIAATINTRNRYNLIKKLPKQIFFKK